MTMHFNLAATAALAELAGELGGRVRFVNWIHDIAAINPDFGLADQLGQAPMSLLAQAVPGFENVVISPERQRQFCKLTGLRNRACPVFPNGVEYLRLFKLTKPVRELVRDYGVLHRDIVIIHPTRIVRRKNIECGIRVLAELKRSGRRCLYLVTGAPDPHNAESNDYGNELKSLIDRARRREGVPLRQREYSRSAMPTSSACTLLVTCCSSPASRRDSACHCSRLACSDLPVFCPRLEPMQSVLKHNVTLFDLDDEPAAIASLIVQGLNNNTGYQARKEVITRYSWERLFDKKIGPIFLDARRELS